jgi:hypothetical protein
MAAAVPESLVHPFQFHQSLNNTRKSSRTFGVVAKKYWLGSSLF